MTRPSTVGIPKMTMKINRTQTMRRGFTFIEHLVVIAIIGIVSVVVLASLSEAREKARLEKSTVDQLA